MLFNKALTFFLSLPKTIFFNLKFLPLGQACRLPILVHWNSTISGNGKIILSKSKFASIKLGFVDKDFPSSMFVFVLYGVLEFKGKASIGTGSELVIRGKLQIGNNFSCSGGTKIDAKSLSSFGEDVLIGHNCVFIDDDGHDLLIDSAICNAPQGYHIGNHVWFGRECLILKGAETVDNIVFGARSVISGKYSCSNVVYAGSPAKLIKQNVDWNH